jgi:hypothetical protein
MVLNNNNVDGPAIQDACVAPLTQGEYEDYSIEFKGASCQDIINVKATPQQGSNIIISWEIAKINWNIYADYESFEVAYKEDGANAFTKISTTNKYLVLQNIKFNTHYKYYIIGYCKSGKINNSGTLDFKLNGQNAKVDNDKNIQLTRSQATMIIDTAINAVDTVNTRVNSHFTVIADTGLINRIIVYPNPATVQLNVEYKAEKNTLVTLSLINTMGNSVLQNKYTFKKGINKISLPVAHLTPGIYFVKVQDNLKGYTKSIFIQ